MSVAMMTLSRGMNFITFIASHRSIVMRFYLLASFLSLNATLIALIALSALCRSACVLLARARVARFREVFDTCIRFIRVSGSALHALCVQLSAAVSCCSMDYEMARV